MATTIPDSHNDRQRALAQRGLSLGGKSPVFLDAMPPLEAGEDGRSRLTRAVQHYPGSPGENVRRYANIAVQDDVLRIPFYANLNGLSAEQVSAQLDRIAEVLGAQYFRDQALLMEVFADQVQAATRPSAHLYGPYVHVWFNAKDELRISTTDATDSNEGATVYGLDQVNVLLDGYSREAEGSCAAPARPRDKA